MDAQRRKAGLATSSRHAQFIGHASFFFAMARAPVLFISLILVSCVGSKLERNLAINAENQRAEFLGLAESLSDNRQTPIEWNAALKKMQSDNLSMRVSRQQLEDTDRQTRGQWLSLVPSLSSFVSVGDSISDLADLKSSDINANLVANLNIPNPFEFHASLYALALQKQNAIWSHELDRRRAYVQLYSAFLESESIRVSELELAKRKELLSDISLNDIDKILKSIATEEQNLKRRRSYHRLSVNQLLNTPGQNWELSGRRPQVTYRNSFTRISLGDRFGKLALNLQTIQIEGAILRLQRVKFQQWPIVNFGLSAPPLYSSNQTNSFSSDQLQFFSGASKSFDLTDIGSRKSLQDANLRLIYTREQLRTRMEFEIVRLQEGRVTYELLLKEEKRLQSEMNRYKRGGSSDVKIVVKDIEEMRDLESQLAAVRRQLQELDLQFLIWDENHWKN